MAHAATAGSDLSLAEYEALRNRGVLAQADVELLDGQVVSMSPQGEAHWAAIHALMRLLAPVIADLRIQAPIHAGARSVPEPDLALSSQRRLGHAPDHCHLVVEVVVTAWPEAQRKLPIYAGAGHEECWVVDVPRRRVLVHDDPAVGGYRRMRAFAGGDVLAVPRTDIAFTVDEIFAIAAEYA